MAWEVKKDLGVRKSDGTHTIILHDPAARTPSEHHVIIHVGRDVCPACQRVTPKDNVGEIDPKELVREVVAALQKSTDDVSAYMRKHGLRERQD